MSSIGEIAKFRSSIQVDTINEFTSASGVTIDGVLLKDSAVAAASGVSANTISEYTNDSGVTIDGLLIKDGAINAAAVTGRTAGTDPATGKIGERKIGTASVALNTSTYTTIASVDLTAGEWDLSFVVQVPTTISATEVIAGIATQTNTNTGHSLGFNALSTPIITGANTSICVASVPISLSGNATYYLTGRSFGAAVTTPGTIRARRAA